MLTDNKENKKRDSGGSRVSRFVKTSENDISTFKRPMKSGLKLITVAVSAFALPVPRVGSIEAYSGFGRAALEGQEIHVRLQKKRAKSDQSYEAEVAVSRSFEKDGYRFRIDGRIDGIFRTDPPRIEEIKTGFNIHELRRRLSGDPLEHPYCLQLLTYGYFYWLEYKVLPELTLHLVSTRRRESLDLPLKLDLPVFETWLDLRLNELVKDTRKAEKRALRRRNMSSTLTFPYEKLRRGQDALMHGIDEGMNEKRPMLLQAPAGLGKTIGVLYPVLKEALSRGQKVVYVTPKNSQHLAAEDAADRFRGSGAKIKSLTITAKAKICFRNEPLCDPAFCEYARDYYAKVSKGGILDILARKRKLTTRMFRALGEEYKACPFELQLDSAEEADVVICDYNYVFAPRSAFGRMTLSSIDQTGKPNLVIDEAHNLPSRSMDYYSPSLSSLVLGQMRSGLRSLPEHFRTEAEELLEECIDVIASCNPEEKVQPRKIDPPVDSFLQQDAKLRSFLSRYLDSDIVIQSRDVIMSLCFYWSAFAEALEYVDLENDGEFFFSFYPNEAGGIVKITCCDASAMLRHRYDDYEQVVGFSATLKPFEYYAQLSGLDPASVRTEEFQSPFPKEHRKLLIMPQFSTRYSDRERNYGKIAGAIERLAALRQGNYFVFFPSFEFLERVFSMFKPDGFTLLRQEREMKAARVGMVLEQFRQRNGPQILFAVQGGTFSEGVDYPGDIAIGAFVIGPPLPKFDFEREQMRLYYEKQYNAGFDYAYAIPAMAKAIQAAGRVIRSEKDRGLIVLMDNRFIQPAYYRSMPADWFVSDVNELVSGTILKDVSEFWEKNIS
jgi:DNA excision repair protein ERCC-2